MARKYGGFLEVDGHISASYLISFGACLSVLVFVLCLCPSPRIFLTTQVFKFACYVSIPVLMTFAVAGNSKVLESIVRHVSAQSRLFVLIPACLPRFSVPLNLWAPWLCRGITWCIHLRDRAPPPLMSSGKW
jgi:hypothetical protein